MMHKFIFTITLLLLTSCSFSSKKDRINRNLVDNKNISLLNIDEDQKIIIRKIIMERILLAAGMPIMLPIHRFIKLKI